MNECVCVRRRKFPVGFLDIKAVRCRMAIVFGVVMIIAGIGLLTMAYVRGPGHRLAYTAGVLVGVCLLVLAILYLCCRGKRLVYLPTRSRVVKRIKYFAITDESVILNIEADSVKFNRDWLTEFPDGGIRVECYYSRDHEFLAMRVSRYDGLIYEVIRDWCIYKGQSARSIIGYLRLDDGLQTG